MISEAPIFSGNSGVGLFVMDRVRTNGGAFVKQADLSSIAYSVGDMDNPTGPAVSSGTLSISTVIFDTLVTRTADPRWPAKAPAGGYNFGGMLPASAFPNGGKRYWVRIDFTPASGDKFTLSFEYKTLPNYPTS